ncbi:MAG TPA: glutaredoxin family protein [Burkholderiales bacterium]|nr:glutaredoxin family protein [Burkholderiales bacterium]
MKKIPAFLLLSLMAGVAGAADMYRWVDENGVVNYTPYPPPSSIKNVEQKSLGGNTIQTGGLSYGMQQAVKNFPLTLYATADCGEPCNDARSHLKKRGIPYTEKNPQTPDEAENFKKLSGGSLQVPLLVVGSLKTLRGYLASEWDDALSAAGYPNAPATGAGQ